MADHLLQRLVANLEILDRRPREMCRDCADNDGVCPNSGLDCDMDALLNEARQAIAALTPGSAAGVGEVTDAEVERASLAYEVALDGEVYGPDVPRIAMRAALLAARDGGVK